MQQLVYFLRKYRFFLFFLGLEIIATALTINNHEFHRSKLVSSANDIIGGFYQKSSAISDYLRLTEENKKLVTENNELQNQKEQLLKIIDSSKISLVKDTSKYSQQYQYINGKIQKNQYSSTNNFLTINLGTNDGIAKEMAVINSKGIVGITEEVSNNYTRVQSILSRRSSISAKLKNNDNHMGNLKWNGDDYAVVQLEGLPRQAKVQKGDTIITSGNSAIFPEGILIGTAIDVTGGQTSVNRVVNIQLFNDMSSLKNIYVIINFDKIEIRKIELNTNE